MYRAIGNSKCLAQRDMGMKFTEEELEVLLARNEGRCEICGEGHDLDGEGVVVDLIVPRSMGGKKSEGNDPFGNVRVMCVNCNAAAKPRNVAARIKQSDFEMISRWKDLNMPPEATISDLVKEALFRMCKEEYDEQRILGDYYRREEWIKFQAIKKLIEQPITELDMEYDFDLGVGDGNRLKAEIKYSGQQTGHKNVKKMSERIVNNPEPRRRFEDE